MTLPATSVQAYSCITTSWAPFSSRHVGLALALLLSPLAGLSLFAGTPVEINLSNGDHLTGELTNRADGKIYFHSPFLGDLVIPETDAAVVELPDTPVESLSGLPPQPTKPTGEVVSAPEVPPAAVAPKPSPKPAKTVAQSAKPKIATPVAPSPAIKPNPARWKGKLEVGVVQKSGRTEAVSVSVRGDAEKKKGPDDILASYRYLYGEQSDKINSDRSDASLRWRHDLSPRMFSQTNTSFYHDRVASIDVNLEQNASLGYRIIEVPRHIVNIGAGLTGRYRDDKLDSSNIVGLGEFFEDYTYKINGRFTLTQNMKIQYSPEDRARQLATTSSSYNPDATNYKTTFNATLQGKVTDHISMNVRFEYEFDNAIANRDAQTDQRITSSIGYAF